ncbi:uncharacterized protein LOC110847466 [Folsomia candida]|uniref:Anaphase-promoting complex subunit CDC26 n=1 Tax=Folsomia candida TaxID=158441 RepID=A0A226ELG4_FOLCA|nr:uncharacterized protein LOC110847466 [Folsomia candida]OXA57977.1 Anaphase-promoting complex subunit CDC26 [Folsomia candida]
MIRRSPTRIELKLEDLNDFEYIQKFEKKKNPSGNVLAAADAQKLVRQERIGLGFRPIRASSNVGSNQGSFNSATAITSAVGGASISDIGDPVTPTNNGDNSGADSGGLNLINNTLDEGMLNLIVNDSLGTVNNTNASNMSMDESL